MTQGFRARQRVSSFTNLRQLASILRLPRLLTDWGPAAGSGPAIPADVSERRPDRAGDSPFDPHLFYPAALFARRLAQLRPSLHADVGSRASDIGVFSGYMPVIYLSARPLYAHLPGLAAVAGDITRLPFPDKSMISLSSLHVIEHVGTGSNGDPVDPAGAVKALGELQRVLGYRGNLYLATLVGRERVIKGHQVFAPETILHALPNLRLRRFSYVGDDSLLHADAPLEDAAQQAYGCGVFEFERA